MESFIPDENEAGLRSLLREGAAELGVILTPLQEEAFFLYKELLLTWNQTRNLTAITGGADIIRKHFLDSLTLLTAICPKPTQSVIDVGTGAGFPSVPVQMICPAQLTLLDSLQKRVNFLEELIKKLELPDTRALHSRAEDAGKNREHREQYDYCLARAVAPLHVLAEYCLPFVREGGQFIAMKGPEIKGEISTSENAISRLGGKISAVKFVNIPFTDMTHSLVLISKLSHTPTGYPRNAVKISKKPII